MHRVEMSRAIRPILPELTRFAHWLVGSRRDCDDVVQSVVLVALERADSLRDASAIRPWLFQIARNTCVDNSRANAVRSRLLVLDGGLEQDNYSTDVDLRHMTVSRLDIERALAKLPDLSRDTVLLVDLWQFSYDEVATILEVPVNTVRSRLVRARGKLVQLLRSDATSMNGTG